MQQMIGKFSPIIFPYHFRLSFLRFFRFHCSLFEIVMIVMIWWCIYAFNWLYWNIFIRFMSFVAFWLYSCFVACRKDCNCLIMQEDFDCALSWRICYWSWTGSYSTDPFLHQLPSTALHLNHTLPSWVTSGPLLIPSPTFNQSPQSLLCQWSPSSFIIDGRRSHLNE